MDFESEIEEAIRRSLADMALTQQASSSSSNQDDHPSNPVLDAFIRGQRRERRHADGWFTASSEEEEEQVFPDSVFFDDPHEEIPDDGNNIFDVTDPVNPLSFREVLVSPGKELSIIDSFSTVNVEKVRCTMTYPRRAGTPSKNPGLNRFHSFGMLDDGCDTIRLLQGPSYRKFIFNNFSDEQRTFLYRNRFGHKKITLLPRQRFQAITGQFSFVELNKPELVQYNLVDSNTLTFVKECPFTYTDEHLGGRFYYLDSFGCQTLVNGRGSPVPSRRHGSTFSSYFEGLPSGLHELGRTTHFARAIILSALMMVAFASCGFGEIERCGTCYLPAMSPCSSYLECNSRECVSGFCAEGEHFCTTRPLCGPRYCDDSINTCCTSQPNCPGDHICVKKSGSLSGICKKSEGMSCSDDSDCASQNCPPGGGVCIGESIGTSTDYCCDPNGYAIVCPTPSPSPSGNPPPAPTIQTSSTPTPSPGPLATASPVLPRIPFDVDNVSSSARLGPGFPFSLFIRGAEALTPCRNGKYLLNLAEMQKPGNTFSSNCSSEGCPYTFDRSPRFGYFEPNFETYDLCPDPEPKGVNLVRAGRDVLVRDEVVTVDLEDSMFTLTFSSGDAPRVVALQLSGQTYTTTCYSSVCFVVVAPELLYHSGKSTVSVFQDGVIIANKVLEIVGQRQCYVKDCWTCNLSNWSCVPKILKALLVILIVLASVIMLYLFFKIGILTFACLALSAKGVFVCLGGFIKIGNNKVKDMSDWFEQAQARRVARVATMALIMVGVSCCDNSTVINSSLQSCYFSGSEEVCSLSFDSIVSLRGPGSSSCLVFSKDDNVFGQLELSMTTNQISCDLVDPYFTSDFDIYSRSIFHCQGGFGSNCTSDCSLTDLRTSSSYFDYGKDHLAFPGKTTCNRQCTGIGCGCVLPTLGCVYTTYSILPQSSVMRVTRPVNCQFSPVISYRLVDSNSKVTTGSFSYEGGYVFDDSVQLQIITSLDRELPSDLPSHVCEGTKSGFCEASFINSPRASTIGDIQSMNQTGLNTGQFIASSDIYIGLNHQNTYNKVVTKQPGYNTDFKALPSFQSGLVWSLDSAGPSFSTKLFSYDDRPSPILVSVQSQNNLTVSRTVTKVCPEFEFLNSTGCHSCSSGYQACFRVKSSCFEGSSLFESQNISPQLVKLTKVYTVKCFQGFSDKSSGKDEFSFDKEAGSYKFELEEGIQLGQETILYSGEKVPAHVSFRKGSWKWWEYLIASVLFLLSALFLLGLLLVIGPGLISLVSNVSTYVRLRKTVKSDKKSDPELPVVADEKNMPWLGRQQRLSRRTGF